MSEIRSKTIYSIYINENIISQLKSVSVRSNWDDYKKNMSAISHIMKRLSDKCVTFNCMVCADHLPLYNLMSAELLQVAAKTFLDHFCWQLKILKPRGYHVSWRAKSLYRFIPTRDSHAHPQSTRTHWSDEHLRTFCPPWDKITVLLMKTQRVCYTLNPHRNCKAKEDRLYFPSASGPLSWPSYWLLPDTPGGCSAPAGSLLLQEQ